jgi:hypothetical protein
VLFEVLPEYQEKACDDLAVLPADRAHANDPALDQLVAAIVLWKSLELFGCNQASGP